MQRVPKRLIDGSQVAATATTYYPVPANTKTTISAMTAVNTTGTARTLTVYLVPSGSSASASNTILTEKTIPARGTYNVMEAIGQTMEASGSIQALADSAGAVTLIASGYETNV